MADSASVAPVAMDGATTHDGSFSVFQPVFFNNIHRSTNNNADARMLWGAGVCVRWKVVSPPANDRRAFRATPLLLLPEYPNPLHPTSMHSVACTP